MGFMDKIGGNIVNGVLGNLSEVSVDELNNEYG